MNTKIYWFAGLVFVAFLFPLSTIYAVHINGYFRSNGTYVKGYERTSPDGILQNNYSYPGNYNPNTGTITGESAALPTYSIPSPSYVSPVPKCPVNAHLSATDSKCYCDGGYQNSSDNSSCIALAKTYKSGLTVAQANSIIALLQSFGADASVIENIKTVLFAI